MPSPFQSPGKSFSYSGGSSSPCVLSCSAMTVQKLLELPCSLTSSLRSGAPLVCTAICCTTLLSSSKVAFLLNSSATGLSSLNCLDGAAKSESCLFPLTPASPKGPDEFSSIISRVPIPAKFLRVQKGCLTSRFDRCEDFAARRCLKQQQQHNVNTPMTGIRIANSKTVSFGDEWVP